MKEIFEIVSKSCDGKLDFEAKRRGWVMNMEYTRYSTESMIIYASSGESVS